MRPLGWQDRALCTHFESFRHTKCLSYFSLRIVGHSPTLWDKCCCPFTVRSVDRPGSAKEGQGSKSKTQSSDDPALRGQRPIHSVADSPRNLAPER